MEDTIQFQNMDNWRGGSGKFGLTFKQIVLMHINRCVVNGSTEWHGGYWQDVGSNPSRRVYVPNSREVYCNSVRMLRACLLGYFDKKIEPIDKKLQEEYQETKKKYSELEEEGKDIRKEWNNFKIEWHIRLFEELIKLSKRLNFFEEESGEEEM